MNPPALLIRFTAALEPKHEASYAHKGDTRHYCFADAVTYGPLVAKRNQNPNAPRSAASVSRSVYKVDITRDLVKTGSDAHGDKITGKSQLCAADRPAIRSKTAHPAC